MGKKQQNKSWDKYIHLTIAMATTFNFLSDLTTEREDWIIRARVTRKWDSINLKADNELISVDIILLDENADNKIENDQQSEQIEDTPTEVSIKEKEPILEVNKRKDGTRKIDENDARRKKICLN
ncbi:hypothetical protein LguiA_036448 [Lonicera macranthoides]